MVKDFDESPENKAGWNASEEIIRTLSMLRNSFMAEMMDGNFPRSLEVVRRILDVISGKVDSDEAKKLNNEIYSIEGQIPNAMLTYSHMGMRLYTNPSERTKVKRRIETTYRKLEALQDQKGYGMIGSNDPRFAVEQR